MEILQLRYFECVAKHESVSKAADELHISQPSLSSSILRLERELGAPLFERNKRKMSLNSYGIYFLNTTRKILDLINLSKLPFDSYLEHARISIAFQNYNERVFSLIQDFHRRSPNIEFNICVSTLNETFSIPAFDFIIGNADSKMPVPLNSLTIEPRGYYVVIPHNHPLQTKEAILIKDLKNETFCFLRDGHGNFEHAYSFCIESGFIPKYIFTTNNSYYKIRFLSEGTAFGIIPSGWQKPYSNLVNAVVRPLLGFEHYTDTSIYWSDKINDSIAAQSFIKFIKYSLINGVDSDNVSALFHQE